MPRLRGVTVAGLVAVFGLCGGTSAVGETLDEAEATSLAATLSFVESNGGLEPSRGIRVGVPADLLEGLLANVVPVSLPLADDLGTLDILSVKPTFDVGFPRLLVTARASLLDGAASVTAEIDAVARFDTRDVDVLRLTVDILAVRPDIGALAKLPGTQGIIEAAASARVASAASDLEVTVPLVREISITTDAVQAPTSFTVGESSVTLRLDVPALARSLTYRVEHILTLPDGVYVYLDVE